jgi:hypothetical protein
MTSITIHSLYSNISANLPTKVEISSNFRNFIKTSETDLSYPARKLISGLNKYIVYHYESYEEIIDWEMHTHLFMWMLFVFYYDANGQIHFKQYYREITQPGIYSDDIPYEEVSSPTIDFGYLRKIILPSLPFYRSTI